MDANGLRFWMLANQADWKTGGDAIYDASTRRLRLKSQRDTQRKTSPSLHQAFWADWTSASIGSPGTATGTIKDADANQINVSYDGEIMFAQTGKTGEVNYFQPDTPYRSETVSNPPTGADIIALIGGNVPVNTVKFSQPVVNPVMAFVSLGSATIPARYQFDAPFTIVSFGKGYWGDGTLTAKPGNILEGAEGHGVILFEGTFSAIQWTIPQGEYWHAFTIGIQGIASDTVVTPGMSDRAEKRLLLVPGARDRFETRAEWQPGKRLVMAEGAVPGSLPIYAPPDGVDVTDLALGNDDILYLASGGKIVLLDRRNRWPEQTLSIPGFAAWRLAVRPNGGVWVLDRDNRQIGIVQGLPLPDRPYGEYAPDTFRPCEENPNPPRIVALTKAVWPGDETPAAIASSPQGRLALLTWKADGIARLRCLDSKDWTHPTFGPPIDLRDAAFAYSLAWLDETNIAVRTVALPGEALVYPIWDSDKASEAAPVGDFYPLRNASDGPFLHGLDTPPHYPTVGADGIGTSSMPLFPLSLPSYARTGQATNDPVQAVFDSGNAQTAWHRLYLEAIFPARCGAKIRLAATSLPVPPTEDNADAWHVHRFGDTPDGVNTNDALTTNGVRLPRMPHGAWVSGASELPFHPGFLPCPREPEHIGLFTVLVQRAGRRVQTLRGRYLWIRVELSGDGRATPEIAALRAYGSRFSYVEQYLPELYHETVFGPDGDDKINGLDVPSSTPGDFLERFVDNFEGILTPLEDKIAASYLLTDARTAPEEALEWLGSWIGMSFDPRCPAATRRRMLANAPELYRRRGTLRGLALALDIATNEAVSRGQVVLLEDFRLRRTFATILGADLAEADDPLLGGPTDSGNSYVGDTLILGDETRREFLALFRADLPETEAETSAIQDWYDSLAYRLTVLVHAGATQDDWARVRRIVALETPAHVATRILPASNALLIGASSLVGVDTYLSPKPKPKVATLDQSQIGSDVIWHLPGLDPRLEADPDFRLPEAFDRPFADAGPGQIVAVGDPITLNAGRSHAAPGHTLTNYIWTLVQSDSPPE